MTSSDPHGDRELAIFHGFSEKCALGIDAASIEKRDPPEPDILCRTVSGESIAFELVEALDSDLARGVYGKLRLEKNFRDAFAALPQAHKDSLSAHVGDALVYVCYDRSLSLSSGILSSPLFSTKCGASTQDSWGHTHRAVIHLSTVSLDKF